ncbi:MAG TPA: hypothetical protein VFF73_33950 [Planctomycetota bacterium]|nr:hypothetical protein [Planctomycetota bacterium]
MKWFLLLALLLLGGCPSKEAAQAPASAELPHVGQIYVFRLLGGGTRQDEVTEVTAERVSLTRSALMPGAVAAIASAAVTHVDESLAGPSPSASIPPGTAYDKIGEETLVVSGESFPCEVRKLKSGPDVREWVSPRWPHLVRTRSGPFTTLELTQVLEKREEK